MKLPVISGKEAAKRFCNLGFEFVHQRGSHMILRLNRFPYTKLSIPNHKTLDRGLLRALIRQAGITPQEFTQLK